MPRKKAEASDEFLTTEMLKEQIGDIQKLMGSTLYFGDDPDLEVTSLPLGIPVLDEALNGGFPFGRFSLIYGESMAGKTTLCLFVIREAQKLGLSCAYIDLEKKLDPRWAEAIGVDISSLIVSRPGSAEAAYEALTVLAQKNFGVVVVDSIAALTTMSELAADSDKKFMGEQARITGQIIRSLNTQNKKTMVLLINQLREKIGVMFGNPESLPGGKAQVFFSTMRVRVRRGSWIEEGTGDKKRKIGYNLRIIVEKDNHGVPFKEAEVPFYFTGKIDEEAALFATALELEIITQRGPYYSFGEFKVMGRESFIDALKNDPELRQNVTNAIESIEEVE